MAIINASDMANSSWAQRKKREPRVSESPGPFDPPSLKDPRILKMGHFYCKLPYGRRDIEPRAMQGKKYQPETAVLLGSYTTHKQYLSKEFIEYDTAYFVGFEKFNFVIPDASLVVLILQATNPERKGEVFTTVRDRYRTDKKTGIIYDNSGYYKDREGKIWEILINLE